MDAIFWWWAISLFLAFGLGVMAEALMVVSQRAGESMPPSSLPSEIPTNDPDDLEASLVSLSQSVSAYREAVAEHNRRCYSACKQKREMINSDGDNCRYYLRRQEQCIDCPHRWMIPNPVATERTLDDYQILQHQ